MGISVRGKWLRHLENVERLQQLRDGIRDDDRESAAMAMAVCLRGLRLDDAEIARYVAVLAAKCLPPLDERAQRFAIATAAEYRAMDHGACNCWFPRLLNVTAYEAEFLTGWSSAAEAQRWAEIARPTADRMPDRTTH